MKKLWTLIGRIGYVIAWPALYVYVRFTKRTRVLIRHNDELLFVKGWLGSNKWTLPGGGLHRNEDTVRGAVREVKEETGIRLEPSSLIPLWEGTVKAPNKMQFYCITYGIDIEEKPELTLAKVELIDACWHPIDRLSEIKHEDYVIQPALAEWNK